MGRKRKYWYLTRAAFMNRCLPGLPGKVLLEGRRQRWNFLSVQKKKKMIVAAVSRQNFTPPQLREAE